MSPMARISEDINHAILRQGEMADGIAADSAQAASAGSLVEHCRRLDPSVHDFVPSVVSG